MMDWKLILYFVVWFIVPIVYSYFRRIKLNIWELYLFGIGIIAIVYKIGRASCRERV